MSLSFIKCRYGASLSGKTLRIVRSTRAVTGRINHSTISWPLSSTSGQPPILGNKHSPVAGCIGIQESLTLWLDTPFTSKNKAIKVLPSMLDVQLPFPLEDCCYCFVQFRRNATRMISVLAIAARRATVQQRLDQYKAYGIDPTIIDHEGLALWQESMREKPPRSGITRVVVSLEPDHISFVIGSGNIFLNAHCLQMPDESGGEMNPEDAFQRMHRFLCAELVPTRSELAMRLRNESGRGEPHGELQTNKPVEWVFCGSLTRQPVVVNSLHRLLSGEWPGSFMVHKSPETFLPRALSSRALAGGGALCNLRQRELTHSDVRIEHKKRSARAALLLLLAGMTICVFNLAWQIVGSLQFKDAKQEISRLTRELAPDRAIPYGREVFEAQKIVQKRMNDFAPVLHIFAQPLSTRLAEIINTGKESRLSYTRLEITRDKIIIGGTTEDWNYCERLAKRLENIGYKAEMERTEGQDDNLVHFTVKGIVR